MMTMTYNIILVVVLVVTALLVVVLSESQIIQTLHQMNDSQITTMFHDNEGYNLCASYILRTLKLGEGAVMHIILILNYTPYLFHHVYINFTIIINAPFAPFLVIIVNNYVLQLAILLQ